MTRARRPSTFTALVLGGLLLPAAPAAAQAPDWTLDVPVRVSSLDPAVRHVVVVCLVGPETVDDDRLHNAFTGTPGGAIDAWEGVNLPPFAAGVVAVQPDPSGSVYTQLSVPVHAPPTMTTAQKLAATTWTCGLTLSPDPTEPANRILAGSSPYDEHAYSWPAEGTPFTAVVTGAFN